MSKNQAFAYRNWCAQPSAITSGTGDFEGAAPVENLCTPQLGQLAIATAENIDIDIGCDIRSPAGSPRPVSVVGLLNHNILSIPIPENDNLVMTIATTVGDFEIEISNAMLGPSGTFARNLWFFLPNFAEAQVNSVSLSISNVVICGHQDSMTGDYVYEPFRAGALWASRLLRPNHGFAFGSIVQGVTERQQRTLSGQITLIGDSQTQAGLTAPTLQDMAMHCGTGQSGIYSIGGQYYPRYQANPVVCFTDITSPRLLHTQSLYGYFDSRLSWQHAISHEAGGQKERSYVGSFSITEAL